MYTPHVNESKCIRKTNGKFFKNISHGMAFCYAFNHRHYFILNILMVFY